MYRPASFQHAHQDHGEKGPHGVPQGVLQAQPAEKALEGAQGVQEVEEDRGEGHRGQDHRVEDQGPGQKPEPGGALHGHGRQEAQPHGKGHGQ
ncbi:hypothetical protein [Thermus antranikianii]